MQAQSSHGSLTWLLLGVASKLLLTAELSMKRMASYTASLPRCKVTATPLGLGANLHVTWRRLVIASFFIASASCFQYNTSQSCDAADLSLCFQQIQSEPSGQALHVWLQQLCQTALMASPTMVPTCCMLHLRRAAAHMERLFFRPDRVKLGTSPIVLTTLSMITQTDCTQHKWQLSSDTCLVPPVWVIIGRGHKHRARILKQQRQDGTLNAA